MRHGPAGIILKVCVSLPMSNQTTGEAWTMHAALQQSQGTIDGCGAVLLPPRAARVQFRTAANLTMTPTKPRELFIQGITRDGKAFRPSDWAERLAGAMSCFRPGGAKPKAGAFIGYSPLCVPRVIEGVRCVIVSEALKGVEPMAWDFVMNFARDNDLQVVEACLLEEPPAQS